MCAGYLFQQDKQYDVTYDTGDKAIQCGRHVDIFKFWLMWKAKVCILGFFFIYISPRVLWKQVLILFHLHPP